MTSVPNKAAGVQARVEAFIARWPWLQRTVGLITATLTDVSVQRISLTAAGVAFWFVIAVFPALIGTLMIAGLVVDPQVLQQSIAEIEKVSPASVSGFVLEQVQAATQTRPSTLSVAFALSLIAVLWTTSSGYYNFARGVQSAYHLQPEKYLRARTRAFVGALVGMLVVAILIVCSAFVLTMANHIEGVGRYLADAAVAMVALAVATGVLTALYRFATGPQEHRLAYWPGALLGAVGATLVFAGFAVYLGFSSNYQSVYGALAGAIIFMVVVYFATFVILIGAALNHHWRQAQPEGRPHTIPGSQPSASS